MKHNSRSLSFISRLVWLNPNAGCFHHLPQFVWAGGNPLIKPRCEPTTRRRWSALDCIWTLQRLFCGTNRDDFDPNLLPVVQACRSPFSCAVVWISSPPLGARCSRKTSVLVIYVQLFLQQILLREYCPDDGHCHGQITFFSDSCSCKILATFSATNIHDS